MRNHFSNSAKDNLEIEYRTGGFLATSLKLLVMNRNHFIKKRFLKSLHKTSGRVKVKRASKTLVTSIVSVKEGTQY